MIEYKYYNRDNRNTLPNNGRIRIKLFLRSRRVCSLNEIFTFRFRNAFYKRRNLPLSAYDIYLESLSVIKNDFTSASQDCDNKRKILKYMKG